MWPNLMPGDILSARKIPASALRPGMVTVFQGDLNTTAVVHRVVSVRAANTELLVTTAGDNSGKDTTGWRVPMENSVTVVTGVLRLGRYRTVTRFQPAGFLNRRSIRQTHLFLVKHLFW